MKIIAVFMAILLSFCPIGVSREKTAPPHRLITEAASAGRKQVKTTETIIVLSGKLNEAPSVTLHGAVSTYPQIHSAV